MNVNAGVVSVEVTLEPGLSYVAMKVFDVTSGYPGSQVGAAIPMVEFDHGNYGATFTASNNKRYAVSKAVYTGNTYATRDTNYPSGSESFEVNTSASSLTLQQIIDGVLDELIGEHQIAGSFAEAVNILARSQRPGVLTGVLARQGTLLGIVEES